MGLFFKKEQLNSVSRRASRDSSGLSSSTHISDTFRRNRNLSTVSVAVSADSSRIKVHHLSIKRRKLSFILLISLICIAVLVFIIVNLTASISISISSADLIKGVDNTRYTNLIQDYLDINPLGRVRFLLNETGLNDYMTSKAVEIKSVAQHNSVGLGITDFEIDMRKPVASWNINGKIYYVDEDGIAFEINYYSDPAVKIVDNSGASIEAGQANISKRFLGFVGKVVSLCEKSGYSVTEAILPENTTRQLNIKLKDKSVLVKMTIDRSAEEQVSDMDRAVEHFRLSGKAPQYIDVRVDNKVFFI